jgi:hypothetical protein
MGIVNPSLLQAATITVPPGNGVQGTAPGITYEKIVQMSDQDTASWLRHVGARSWNEPNNPPGLKGWTHTSDWAALELLQPSRLTIEIARESGVSTGTSTAGDNLYPAFSLYSGWQEDGDEEHEYNNQGNTAWAEDIFYLAHDGNSTEETVRRSFILPAGRYSLAIGSNPPDNLTVSGRQGYSISLSSTPVPEPTMTIGLLFGALAWLGNRRMVG